MKRRNFHLPIAFTLWVNIVEEADDGADRWASGVDIAFANEKLEKLCNFHQGPDQGLRQGLREEDSAQVGRHECGK
jgi:hypothetical protein